MEDIVRVQMFGGPQDGQTFNVSRERVGTEYRCLPISDYGISFPKGHFDKRFSCMAIYRWEGPTRLVFDHYDCPPRLGQ